MNHYFISIKKLFDTIVNNENVIQYFEKQCGKFENVILMGSITFGFKKITFFKNTQKK